MSNRWSIFLKAMSLDVCCGMVRIVRMMMMMMNAAAACIITHINYHLYIN